MYATMFICFSTGVGPVVGHVSVPADSLPQIANEGIQQMTIGKQQQTHEPSTPVLDG